MDEISTCPHYPACSGCSLIGVPYADQLAAKLRRVRESFEQAGLPDFDASTIQRITRSPDLLGYRNRVKLVPSHGRGTSDKCGESAGCVPGGEKRVELGLYRRGSHDVVDIPDCPIHASAINQVIEVTREAIGRFSIPLYDEVSHTGELRFVTVRRGAATGEVLVGFVTRTRQGPALEDLAGFIMAHHGEVVGVVQNVNPEKGNVIFGPTSHLLTGRAYLAEVVCGLRVRLGLTSFFQINTAVAERAYRAIIDSLSLIGSDTLLDLYCGVGAINLVAAGHVRKAIGLEEVKESIEFARAAARNNNVVNVEFQAGPVEELLPELIRQFHQRRLSSKHLAVVTNPPRSGMSPAAIDALLHIQPSRIAYLSCSPPALLRDLRRFGEAGYHIEHVELFDIFPQTDQVETLAVLRSQPNRADGTIRRRF